MAPGQNNVNTTDINPALDPVAAMPLDVMGLFFFAYRDFVGDADALLERQGFGRAHHRVLYFVNLKPGMPVADLLDILKITKQSLARVLRQLIDNGYIEQKTGDADRRQRLLHLTPRGESLRLALMAPQIARIRRAIAQSGRDSGRHYRTVLYHLVSPENRDSVRDWIEKAGLIGDGEGARG